jgi:hypothetical protein
MSLLQQRIRLIKDKELDFLHRYIEMQIFKSSGLLRTSHNRPGVPTITLGRFSRMRICFCTANPPVMLTTVIAPREKTDADLFC